MEDNTGTLERISLAIAQAMEPLSERLAAGEVLSLFAELGLQFPPELLNNTALRNAVNAGAATASQLPALIGELSTAIENQESEEIVSVGVRLVEVITSLTANIDALADALKNVGGLPGIEPQDISDFAAGLPSRLPEYLLITYLQEIHPVYATTLALLGVVEIKQEPEDPGNPSKPSFARKGLNLNRVKDLFSAPGKVFQELYGWGTPTLAGELILDRLHDLLFALGVPTAKNPSTLSTPAILDLFWMRIYPDTTISPPGLNAQLPISLANGLWLKVPILHPIWSLDVETRGHLDTGLTGTLSPPAKLSLEPPTGTIEGQASLSLVGEAPDGAADSFTILGQTAKSRIAASFVKVSFIGRFKRNSSANAGEGELLFEATIEQGKVVVNLQEADGFLLEFLPPTGLETDFALALDWSQAAGVHFRGEAGLETTIPLHKVLGPITLETLYLALAFTQGGLEVQAGLTGNGRLGPVVVSIDRIGLASNIQARQGNLGRANLDLHFQPPRGAALSIDAGAVTGGGFLFFDPDREQYAGGMHLEFEGGIALNAIGLLTTRMPDNTNGFSLLVLVQAAGFAPIQLGFGFTLNGVGGLLGINRTVATEVLRAGIRSRSLEPVLFSRDDPTPRAPQIVSTLQSVFPPARDRHVFGPMALIGWGTPTVLTIQVALVLELPAPIRLMVLGRLRAALPKPDAALVTINMDAFGLLDFERREASVDATLYDSKVGPFALAGDMALRARWGDQPAFLLSIGGFHPAFSPPPGVPALRRLAIALSTGNNPRLRAEAYLAITSNTVQIGAGLEFYVEALGFSLEGGFGFDALLQLSPFRFQVDIRAYLALRRGRTTLAGLDVRLHLDGPTPWHAAGQATIRILFFSVTVPFEATFGDPAEIPPRVRVPIWERLKPELQNRRNWTAQLPEDAGRLAAFRDGGAGVPLVHPLGTASVSQRVVPLGRTITRFGAAEPADHRRFEISGCEGLALKGPNFEFFAPAQFFAMSDAQKLSSPSFDRMPSGARIEASGGAVACGEAKIAHIAYEVEVVDDEERLPQEPRSPYVPSADALASLAEIGPAANAEVRGTGRARFRPPGDPLIEVAEEGYAVADTEDLGTVAGIETDGSYTGALEALREEVGGDAGKAGRFQVVRVEEVAPA